MRTRRAIAVLLLGLAACGHRPKTERIVMQEPAKPAPPPSLGVTRATVDAFLKPGDFIFRTVNPTDPLSDKLTGALIRRSQSAIDTVLFGVNEIKRLVGDSDASFDRAISAGDPNAVHLAIYLGGGEDAEAFGSTPGNASVNVWPLFEEGRKGTAWRVFRHEDPRVAAEVVAVARRWATGRMGYRVPLELFVKDAAWNDRARAAAREYAAAADVAGGPESHREMFCTQFAVAVLQAAMLRLAGATPAPTDAQLEALPREARVDSLASPLRVYGEWEKSGAFQLAGQVVVE